MIDFIYKLLNDIGFTHPLHPAMTHIPMGMIIGGFAFAAVSLYMKKPDLARTAHHCFILALITVLPTIILGIMDWQHSFEGEWSTLIKIKFVLAILLSALLAVAVKLGKDAEGISNKVMAVYTLCLFNAIGLGFTGGELQYG